MRMEELRQSERIIRQALDQIPAGPVILDDWRYVLPPKPEVYGTIEGLIAHFKLVMEGVQVPKGEVYAYTEAANGELGWYVVSNGSGRPYKAALPRAGHSDPLGAAAHDRGLDAGGSHPHLRLDQHDRRRGRAVGPSRRPEFMLASARISQGRP